jgi:Raf kinase inhibitor-like YbhB/YbcL family protein
VFLRSISKNNQLSATCRSSIDLSALFAQIRNGENGMSINRDARFILMTLMIAASVSSFAAEKAPAADVFALKSSTFDDGKMMPKKVANSAANTQNNPNCVGDNVSPEFSWSNVPGGTKSFVMLMTDPEGRGGAGVVHWVAYGIPASVTGFAEGEVSKPSEKYVGGKSTRGVGFYSGPCTPPNTMPHHYTFVLIATDFDPKELQPGLTRDEVIAKIAPDNGPPVHAKGDAGLVGLFVNPWRP